MENARARLKSLLIADTRIPHATLLRHPEDLKIAAKVRWATQVGSLWMAGLAFEQMSDARYARLLQHLHIIEAWQLGDVHAEVPATKVRFTVKE